MQKKSLVDELSANSYPGRGIIIGRSADGKYAVAAYFIMGRSGNSRNRVFVEDGTGIRTEAFDPSKMTDPSLIIYSPVRVLGNKTIVTNGDQTDTIYELMDKQQTFEQALRTRTFEPDAPNYTPRISGIMHVENGMYNYAMSIIKSAGGNIAKSENQSADPDSGQLDADMPSACRYTFAYENPASGEAHFIHTYMGDGDPLPSFEGEPTLVDISSLAQGETGSCGGMGQASGGTDIDAFADFVWKYLNEDNKVSLFVRYIDIATGEYESRIINKNMV